MSNDFEIGWFRRRSGGCQLGLHNHGREVTFLFIKGGVGA